MQFMTIVFGDLGVLHFGLFYLAKCGWILFGFVAFSFGCLSKHPFAYK